ncbi:MAG: diguanylate cyclase [Atopobiaceae bacterium]|nr:diguanylate cyclase [Atopobiaceae bacterium]
MGQDMHEGFIFTNERCVGCNRCVRSCSSFGASISESDQTRSRIRINPERCIVCGACIDACTHGARDYMDDTDALLDDLKAGEAITVLVAPAFAAKYPDECYQVLGTLKQLGVRHVLPVSLGADICTWAYLRCMEEDGLTGMISTSCPAVVSYVEHWMPDMISRLMPVKSPLLCMATYCREELGITDKLAFLGPCIAKRLEVERSDGLLSYNVTFPKLMERLDGNYVPYEGELDELEYGLGSYYPAPGGLADNVRWFLGDDTPIRIVSGKQYLYERFEKHRRSIFSDELLYALIDALNCQEGCIEGTAKALSDHADRGLVEIHKIRKHSKSANADSPWNQDASPSERLQRLNRQFAGLNLDSYRCSFVDQSHMCEVRTPKPDEAERIYLSLHKHDEASRVINCSACGYESCYEMVVAIHNGFNTRYNCAYFEKEETAYLTRMSYNDQLTGVLNRNALERTKKELFGRGHSLALVVADVDGLKHVNDSLGHTEGDTLITMAAKALASRFGRERVFRTGGDEFLVVLQDFTKPEATKGVDFVKTNLMTFGVSVSMGLAFTEDFDENFDRLLRLADARMYEDKAHYYESTGTQRRV